MVEFKKILNKACGFIAHPLEVDPVGFVLLFLLSSGINIIGCSFGSVKYGLYVLAFAFLQFYGFQLLVTLSPKVYRVIKPILTFFLLIYFCINLSCYQKFRCILSPDISEIIFATNRQEIKEFFSEYFRFRDIYLLGGVCLLSLITYFYSFKVRCRLSSVLQRCIVLIIVVLSFAIVRNNKVATVYWDRLWKFEFNVLTDLSLHYTHPVVEYTEDNLPDKVVVIIGESFTRSHSSLYGYPIETNPRLGKLRKDSSLVVFSQVISPATHTVESFKHLLNTHLVSDSINWYEATTIIELFKCMGYTSHWMSNQGQGGKYDLASSAFARICDTKEFVVASGGALYDDELLKFEVQQDDRHLYFYHLMGQHGAFDLRYPPQFDTFPDSLYWAYPEHQIKSRRTYDNATLYNDYVCSEIIKKFQSDDALVFYFPDHGQDFYAVDDQFCGHGRMGIPASVIASKQIPFVVYLSSICKEKHPKLFTRVLSEKDRPLCTDAFTFLVMRLLDVDFVISNR